MNPAHAGGVARASEPALVTAHDLAMHGGRLHLLRATHGPEGLPANQATGDQQHAQGRSNA